ncbi:hypothetical protein CRENPOLYSF2_1340004 [Crenothrix polyspora]|uniref:Uncharacterized protein n=1 Tax=Crenothrix polyspora TaxID=360316 RepID=A0A1R4H0P7_9GAMM|nr:hypothetical protein CRENPOLYSF2_1340004 [Crenothrix polyspora]
MDERRAWHYPFGNAAARQWPTARLSTLGEFTCQQKNEICRLPRHSS